MDLVTQVAESIDQMIGQGDWSADHPYVVQMVDTSKGVGYAYELRRGDNWVIIMETRSNGNESAFRLQKKGDRWEYLDDRLAKTGVSSLPELQKAYERITIAREALKPETLNVSQRKLS